MIFFTFEKVKYGSTNYLFCSMECLREGSPDPDIKGYIMVFYPDRNITTVKRRYYLSLIILTGLCG